MNKPSLPPINTTASSTSGRDRRPSSAIFIGSSGGVGLHSSSSASSLSSPLPSLPTTSPLSSVSPALSTSSSHSLSRSQLPSPPSTTAGSTGSAGDGDGDRDRDRGMSAIRRGGPGHHKTSSSSSSLDVVKLGNRLSISSGMGLGPSRGIWEDEQEFETELDTEQLRNEEIEEEHTARHRTRYFNKNESGKKTVISLDHDLNTTTKHMSGSETEREKDQNRQSSRTHARARTPERRTRSSSGSNASENDNDATPPASGRRTVRIGENSPRKQSNTMFSIVDIGKRTRTVSLLEQNNEPLNSPVSISASPMPVSGPGPSTLTSRRARAPLPREFRSDRISDLSGSNSKSTDDVQLEASAPFSPQRSRESRASTLRDFRKNKRTYRLSLGDSRSPEHDYRGANDNQSTSSATYSGRRQTVRQTGSAESALARQRGSDTSSRGFVASERSVVGEGFRAAGLVRRSTVAGPVRKQNQTLNQNANDGSFPPAPSSTSPSRRRDREIPASRYSTVGLDIDGGSLSQHTGHSRAATSMAIYRDRRDRDDDGTLSVTTSRRALRSSLDGDRNSERERPSSTLRFTPINEPHLSNRTGRGPSPAMPSQQPRQQQPASSSPASTAGTDHTRLLLNSLQIFDSHLSKPYPTSSASSSTLSSTFPDLQAHASTLVQSAHTLNELLRTLTSRALESQIEAEIGDAPTQVDAGEMWRIVGAEYREGLRVSDDLVRVVTTFLIVFGRVLRDVAKKTGGATSGLASSSMSSLGERERGTESPDVGGESVISGTSSGQKSAASRHSLDGALRVRPARRSTGMEGISLPTSGEGRRSVEAVSPHLSLGGRRSADLALSTTRIERESRDRITGRRSMDGVGGYVSHSHTSSAETLKHERVFLDIPRPSTSLSLVRRERERIRQDREDENEEDGDETARDNRREKERRATLDRLSLRRTVLPRLRDGISSDFRFGAGSPSAKSSRADLDEGLIQTPVHAAGISQAQLHLLAQAQAQDSPTPAPRASSTTLNSRRQLAIPPPLPSLPSESFFKEGSDNFTDNNANNVSSKPTLPSSSSLIQSSSAISTGSGVGSIRRRPKFSNTSITTVRGSISGLGSNSIPILSPSTPVPTTALSNDEVEINNQRDISNTLTHMNSTGGSVRVRSGTLSLRNLQERDRVSRERLSSHSGIMERDGDAIAEREQKERVTERKGTDTMRKRALSSASTSQSGSGEDLILRPRTSTPTVSSSSTLSRMRTLRSRTRPRMSLNDVDFDGGEVGTIAHAREASSPAIL